MSVVYVHSECIGCGKYFTYHPNRVPSLRVEGIRQPICRQCVEHVNPIRKARGLDAIEILDGAYTPACESSIDWYDTD